MEQVLLSLDAVTSDTISDVVELTSLKTSFAMHSIITITVENSTANLALDASWDGIHWSALSVQSYNNASGAGVNENHMGGFNTIPAMFIRARAFGLGAGAAVTVLFAIAD